MEIIENILKKLSKWTLWAERNNITGIDCPGIYLVAKFDNSTIIPDEKQLISNIIYIGKSEQKKDSLKKRLENFNKAITSFCGHHSGGCELVRKFSNLNLTHKLLSWPHPEWLYVSIIPLEQSDASLGFSVEEIELLLLKKYSLLHGRIPVCNRK